MAQKAQTKGLARLLIGCGVVLMLAAALDAGWQAWRIHRLHRADGHVAEIAQTMDRNGHILRVTHVVFLTPGLQGMRPAIVSVPSSIFGADLQPGNSVPMAYGCCDGARDAEAVNWGRVYGLAITLGLTGMVIFDAGWIMLLARRWREISPADDAADRRKNRARYAHFFGASDSQRPYDRSPR